MAISKPANIEGRILVNGDVRSGDFARRPVLSAPTFVSNRGVPRAEVLGSTPDVSPAIMVEALQAAAAAWDRGTGGWPKAHMGQRIAALQGFCHDMAKTRNAIVELLMWEIGKTRADSESEFDRTLTYINDTLEAAKQLDRDNARLQFNGGIIAQIRRAPLGVTLCMGPFNYPLNETFTTLIPALVMGNTAVVKMARFGQLFWEHLLEPFAKNLPAGVVNIVNGDGKTIIGEAMKTGLFDILAFIGSSRVGDIIRSQHPRLHRLRCILGLDAKNPAIVFPDADLNVTMAETVKGSLTFNGQRCTALKILFVHRSIEKEFTRRFVEAVEALKRGFPWDEGVHITHLPDPGKGDYLRSLIDDAVAKGATLANPERGGKSEGQLFHPAVLSHVSMNSRLAVEEQFGPVVPIVPFDDVQEFEDYVVSSNFGQQASLFGKDPATLGKLIDKLANQICRVNLNTQCQRGPDVYPFTGRKDSAEGTLSVGDALRAFSIRSMVAAKQDPMGKTVVKSVLDSNASEFLSTDFLI